MSQTATMTKNRHPNKHKGIWITVSIAAICLVYGYCVFLPGQQKTRLAEQKLHEMQRYVVESTRLTSSIRHAEKAKQQARGRVEAWREDAPTAAQLAAIYAQISQHAENAETKISRFAPQATKELQSIQQVPVHVSCRGEMPNIVEFIASIESMDATIWVDGLSLRPSSPDGQTLLCEFTLTIFAQSANFDG